MDATASPPPQLQVWQGHRLPLKDQLRASRRQRWAASSYERQHAPAHNACGLSVRISFGAALRYSTPGALMLGRGVLFAVLVGTTGQASSQVTWQAVRGTDLRAILADHELADGVHYAYQFRAAGTFTGFSMGKDVHGTWRLVGDEFCWTLAKRAAKEECFEVERRGTSIRFLRDGYEAFSATVTPVKTQTK